MNRSLQFPRWVGLLGLALFLASAASVGWIFKHGPPSPDAAREAAAENEAQGIGCFGYVDVEHGITSLYPLQVGRVAEVLVHEADAVPQGAVLLRMDDQLARARVEEAQAALESAEFQLAEARRLPEQQAQRLAGQKETLEAFRLRLAGARHLLARKQELLAIHQINSEEVAAGADLVKELEALARVEEDKVAELKLHDPALAVSRAAKEAAVLRARLVQAHHELEECALKAPRAGTVLRILVSPGEVLSTPPRQAAILFCPDEPRLIRAEIEQEFAGRIQLHQKVVAEDDTSASRTWTGQVWRISDWYTQRRSAVLDPQRFTDSRTVECLITLDADQPALRIGQRMRVTINLAR